MYNLDAALTSAMNNLAGVNSFIDILMIWSSIIGVPLLVITVAGQWWIQKERLHTRHVLIVTGFSFLVALALNQFILLFIHRMRPYDAGLTHLLIAPSPDFSFPSDHATASITIAAAFLLYGFRYRGIVFLIAALLISFSRIYIGTHYVSDVVGGMATGIIAVILVRIFYREGTRLDSLLTHIW